MYWGGRTGREAGREIEEGAGNEGGREGGVIMKGKGNRGRTKEMIAPFTVPQFAYSCPKLIK